MSELQGEDSGKRRHKRRSERKRIGLNRERQAEKTVDMAQERSSQ